MFTLKHFKHYQMDKPFTVISDHRPLQWLHNQKDHTGRLGRWAILLENLNYKIKYRPGRIHQNADCLSRLKIASVVTPQIQEIHKAQQDDELCQEILKLLECGELPEKYATPPVWAKEIELYSIRDGLLYRHVAPSSSSRRLDPHCQLVLPLSLRPLVLKQMHDGKSGGHLAYIKTFKKIGCYFYWPSMRADIEQYVKACATCQANKKMPNRPLLHPHELATAPFEVIGIDFLGPIKPLSANGNSYVLVIVDYFSKWVEAIPLPDQKATTTASALYKCIIQRHGMPKAIISDRGTNFTSKLFEEFCQFFGINHRLTTAYHPASNGETERFNRTLISMLRKTLEDGAHGNWEEALGDVCFAYRASPHSSTLESPYYLVHGRDPNIPIARLLNAIPEPVAAHDFLSTLTSRLQYSFLKAREASEKAREEQRKKYDARAKQLMFKVNDKVLLATKIVKPGDSKKFTDLFKGPFRVTRVHNNQTVDISDNAHRMQRVHLSRLRPFYETSLWERSGEAKANKNCEEKNTQPETNGRSKRNLRPKHLLKQPDRLIYK